MDSSSPPPSSYQAPPGGGGGGGGGRSLSFRPYGASNTNGAKSSFTDDAAGPNPNAVSMVRLWHDKREREMYDNFADLFAIIKTTEKLEKAYVRDVVSATEYEPACSKLIAQFRTLKTALKDSVPDVEQFAETYKMDCPAALNRLLVSGIPATVEHKSASSDSGTAAAVAECVQIFITAMDTLKLNMLAVDQVHPMMSDLILALSRVPQLSPDFVGKVKVKEWIARLNKMGASEELTQEQARQLSFDLEMSYNGFIQSLPKSS